MYAVLGGSVAQLINAVQGNCKTRYVYEKEVNMLVQKADPKNIY